MLAFAAVGTMAALVRADDKPAAPAPKEAACCAKAEAKGEKCKHECCVEAAKAGENCAKCGGSGKAEPKKTS